MNNSGLLIHAVLDEISLEGLDGLTIPSKKKIFLPIFFDTIFPSKSFHRLMGPIICSPQITTATECQLLQSNLEIPSKTKLIALL